MTAKKKIVPSIVRSKVARTSDTRKPEFTFKLDEADFDRLIFEPVWSIDYIANVFRGMEYKPANAAIRLLDQAYKGVNDYFVDAGGLMDRPENQWKDGKIFSAVDVAAYRKKLSPMFELIDMTKDMDTEDELHETVSILRIMGQFFDRAAGELEAIFVVAKKEAGAA